MTAPKPMKPQRLTIPAAAAVLALRLKLHRNNLLDRAEAS